MWHYSNDQRFRMPAPAVPPGAQSTYDLVVGLRGMAITLLGAVPGNLPGFLEEVSATALSVGVAAPLPALNEGMIVCIEVLAGPGVLRFQTASVAPVVAGETRIQVAVPRQVETVQRRMYSRAPVSVQVVFTAHSPGQGESLSGIGQSLDLSAGGLRLITQTALSAGQSLYLSFSTPDGVSYRGIEARVTRAVSNEGRWTVSLTFPGLSAAVENDLVRTVYRLQMRNPAVR